MSPNDRGKYNVPVIKLTAEHNYTGIRRESLPRVATIERPGRFIILFENEVGLG